MKLKNFITLQEFAPEELEDILTNILEAGEQQHFSSLKNKTVVNLLSHQSLHTRLSLESAVKKLGGSIITVDFNSEKLNLLHEEGVMCLHENMNHVKDISPFLDTCGDAIAISDIPYSGNWKYDRQNSLIRYLARYTSVPIINLESSLYNPFQGLADILTIKELLRNFNGWKAGIVWTYHPYAHSMGNVNEFALAASKLGMDLTIAHPPGFDLDSGILKLIEKNTFYNRSSLEVSNKLDDAVSGAHVVYAVNWRSCKLYNDRAKEEVYQKQYSDWNITKKDMDKTDGAHILHPYPIRRNVCVMEDVLEQKNSMIHRQIKNKALSYKYVLAKLLGTQ